MIPNFDSNSDEKTGLKMAGFFILFPKRNTQVWG